MADLFAGDSYRDVAMSPDRIYRYRWSASWAREATYRVLFVMLNPSTADEHVLDPTVKKTIRLAQRWAFNGLDIANVFAYRSTDPKGLYKVTDPVGPENDAYILTLAERASAVVVAWGKHANRVSYASNAKGRGDAVAKLLERFSLLALRINGDGSPEHPLYVPDNIQPQPWKAQGAP